MKKEYIYAFTSVFIWSTIAPVTKLLTGALSAAQILAGSSFFACISLFVICIITKKLHHFKSHGLKDYMILILLGVIGIFIYNYLLNTALTMLSAQEAFIINYLWPITTMLFAIPILHEKFSAYKLFTLFISFSGVAIIAVKGNFADIRFDSMAGAAMAFTAAVLYGLFSDLDKKFDYDKTFAMTVYYTVTFIFSAILAGFSLPHLTLPQLVGIAWLGIFTQGIGYTTWALALKSGDTAKVSNLAFITPLLSTFLSGIFLHETMHSYIFAGLVLILGGILVQTYFGAKASK